MKIDPRYIFPLISMAINVGSVVVHLWKRDLYGAGYWFCAAGITFFATFGRR